jgi:hypothetical protein
MEGGEKETQPCAELPNEMRRGAIKFSADRWGGISKERRSEIRPGSTFFLMPRETEADVERTHRNRSDLYGIKIHVHIPCDDEGGVVALWRINV